MEGEDMKKKHRSALPTHRKLTLVTLAVIVGGALAALAATAGHAAVAQGGFMTPSVGPDPKISLVGKLNQPGPLRACQRAGVCYGPDQLRNAYGFQSLLDNGFDGTGTTIVIIDAYGSDTIQSDLALFDGYFGLPAANLNIIQPDGPPSPTSAENLLGWKGETTLDVETAHAIAPGATIDLVEAKSNNDSDILSATEAVARGNYGDVLSQSYGEAEACMSSKLLHRQHAVFSRLAGNGTTLFASSGDTGAGLPTCDGQSLMKAASTPATDPKVTAVGGTDLTATAPTFDSAFHELTPGGQYESETVWNDGVGAAEGAGISSVYARPGFQNKVVSGHKREIPDIAYSASAHHVVLAVMTLDPGAQGALFGLPAGGTFFFGFSGTSCGSPQWSALAAIANEVAGHRLGDINPTLYALGRSSEASVYHDVTVGDNSVGDPFDIVGFSAGVGWDQATGWGSPKANNLVPALAAASR
jgi:subtilase family serine protease